MKEQKKKEEVVLPPMADIRRIRDRMLIHKDAPKYVKRFLHLKSTVTKVDYVDYILAHLEVFQRMLLTHRHRRLKNRALTAQFIRKGIKCYTQMSDKFGSMIEFNHAVANAEIGSVQMAMAYSERSSIYYEWRMYDESLRNIRLAYQCELSELLRDELRIREKTCKKFRRFKKFIGQGSSSPEDTSDDSSDENVDRLVAPEDEYFDPRDRLKWSSEEEDEPISKYRFNLDDIEDKLSYEANPSFPHIASVIDVKKLKDNDYKLYSNTDLKISDVIAIEDPFTWYVPMFQQCSVCMNKLIAPIPCEKCTRVLFCSQECYDRAKRTFHRYECPIIDTLLRIFDDVHMATLRVAITALGLFPNLTECMEFCKNPLNKKEVFELNFNDLDKIEYYKTILNWKKSKEKDSFVNNLQVCLVTCIAKRILLMNSDLIKEFRVDTKLNFLGEFLYHHFETCPIQTDTITAYMDRHNGKKTVEFSGHGVYGLYPLMKVLHESESNIMKVYRETKCLYVVNRPIPANTPLIQSYSTYTKDEHDRMPKSYDAITLFDTFQCIDFPQKLNLVDVAPILNGDKNFAREQYRNYGDYLATNKVFYKSYQMRLMEKTFFITVSLLADAVPLESLPSPEIDEDVEF